MCEPRVHGGSLLTVGYFTCFQGVPYSIQTLCVCAHLSVLLLCRAFSGVCVIVFFFLRHIPSKNTVLNCRASDGLVWNILSIIQKMGVYLTVSVITVCKAYIQHLLPTNSLLMILFHKIVLYCCACVKKKQSLFLFHSCPPLVSVIRASYLWQHFTPIEIMYFDYFWGFMLMLFWIVFLSPSPPPPLSFFLMRCGAYQLLIKNNFTLKSTHADMEMNDDKHRNGV